MTLKEQILAATKKQDIPVTIAGVSCFIRPLSYSTLLKWHSLNEDESIDKDQFPLYLIPLSIVDADGTFVFALNDIATVDNLDKDEITQLLNQIFDINNLGADVKKN